VIRKLAYRLKKKLLRRKPKVHPLNTFGTSETNKCRERLAPFCTGYGLDLGFGGDPITLSAIRMDFPQPYTQVGKYPVQLGGSADSLHWFGDDQLDFVYSSHLLEDFVDTEAILREWIRVLKPGGKLVTFCPDEQRFRKHCQQTGQPYNTAHVHEFFSLQFVKDILDKIGKTKLIYEQDNVDIYSWDLVVEKL
jgi:SAM-dependent methyltransferase